MMAVGVGPFVGQRELELIAGNRDRTLAVESYGYMFSHLNTILRMICGKYFCDCEFLWY